MIEALQNGIIEPLTKDQLTRIHVATLEVLENIGVKIEEENALRLMDNIGADVNFKSQIVKIPQHLVKEAIKYSPETVPFCGRNPKYDIKLHGKRINFGLGGGATSYLDVKTGLCRPSTKQDVANAAKLADALPNLDFVMSQFTSQDKPQHVLPLHDLHAMIKNTEKPIMVVDYGLDAEYLIKLAAVLVNGKENLRERPLLGMYSEPISPLTHGRSHTRNLMTFAKAHLPIAYIPSPASCSTAPVTLAGAIVQSNAETLSGNVIAQFTCKGARYIYGISTSVMDMKSGVFSYGAPEWMITNLIMAQLGRHYGLPVWSTGGCSDSKILDAQAVTEAALTLLMATQSGANLIHDVGSFLNFGLTGCLELVTICDELISMFKYLLRGIKVSDETLALDIIAKTGPGGHYLSHEHTRRLFFDEHWMPSLFDRQMKNSWIKDGSKDLVQRAGERTVQILKDHVPNSIPNDINKELDATLKNMEKTLTKN